MRIALQKLGLIPLIEVINNKYKNLLKLPSSPVNIDNFAGIVANHFY